MGIGAFFCPFASHNVYCMIVLCDAHKLYPYNKHVAQRASRLASTHSHPQSYCSDWKQGLDAKDSRVRRLRCTWGSFALVQSTARFAFHYIGKNRGCNLVTKTRRQAWSKTDRDGPWILLRGLRVIWGTIVWFSWTDIQSFPCRFFSRG